MCPAGEEPLLVTVLTRDGVCIQPASLPPAQVDPDQSELRSVFALAQRQSERWRNPTLGSLSAGRGALGAA